MAADVFGSGVFPACSPAPIYSASPLVEGRLQHQQEITALLHEWRGGNDAAFDRLLPLVYEELRQIAHRLLLRENPGHTLSTTALVHECYLRLVDQTRADWADRGHFFAVAATAMRRVLVDHARGHTASKRGAGKEPVALDNVATTLADERAEELLALDDALTRLAELSERLARVVECRFFGGLTTDETAAALGVTTRTVERDWAKAKGWLYQQLGGE
jgi:RNA polymerase sigma factor (TIGR02999 family)